MLQLKEILASLGKTQRELALDLHVSPATVAQICNHGIFPKSANGNIVRLGILRFLETHGASVQDRHRAFDAVPTTVAEEINQTTTNENQPQETDMLLQKIRLTDAAKQHFNLKRDPFMEEVKASADVFITPDIYYVLDSMMDTARRGGFKAIVGESGAGKSTLVEEMEERLLAESPEVLLIKPFILGMEGDDNKGKRLKATSILDAILRRVDPERPRRMVSLEDKSNATFEALQKSAKDNPKARHCLIIEEAHRLAVPTLRHLKGFHEMKIGRTPLLSIILIGQPELGQRLRADNHDLREVIQRCEVVSLNPLDNHLEAFLKFKFERVGKAMTDVIDVSGIDQIRTVLSPEEKRANSRTKTRLSPLMVSNLITQAMNATAKVGMPRVNADAVNEAMAMARRQKLEA